MALALSTVCSHFQINDAPTCAARAACGFARGPSTRARLLLATMHDPCAQLYSGFGNNTIALAPFFRKVRGCVSDRGCGSVILCCQARPRLHQPLKALARADTTPMRAGAVRGDQPPPRVSVVPQRPGVRLSRPHYRFARDQRVRVPGERA